MTITRWEGMAYDETTTGVSHEGVQLLNDGRVLVLRGGSDAGDGVVNTWILEPDQFGSYANRVARRVGDTAAGHHGAPMVLHDDGMVTVHGDHPGSLGFGGEGVSERFDPATETWVGCHNLHNHQSRVGVIPLEHGKILAMSPSATEARRVHLMEPNGYGGQVLSPAEETGFGYLEGQLAQIPDGRIFVNVAPGTNRSFRWACVQYPPDNIAEGTHDAPTGYLTTAEQVTWDPTKGGWKGSTRPFNNHYESYEGGLGMYVPIVDRVAFVTALGDLFTCHPDHPTQHVWSSAPRWISASATGWPTLAKVIGEVTSWDEGAGTLVVTPHDGGSTSNPYGASGTYTGEIGVETTNGVALIEFTAHSTSGDGTWIPANQITFTGCTKKQWDTGGTIPVGARAHRCQPFPGLTEGPLCVLPSGMLLMPLGFMLGTSSTADGWVEYPSLWVWNGVDDPYILPDSLAGLTGDNGSSAQAHPLYGYTYEMGYVVLPTGQVLITDTQSRYFHLYTPEGAEAVIPDAYRPTIEAFPTAVKPGFTYRLRGRQLWGRHYGSHNGDDHLGHCNNPQARLTATADSRVWYCPTSRYTYRGIQADRVSHMDVKIPSTVPEGTYTFEIISVGAASAPVTVTVSNSTAANTPSGGSGGMFDSFSVTS